MINNKLLSGLVWFLTLATAAACLAAPAGSEVPPDQAVVEVFVPAGATVRSEGKALDGPRLVLTGLRPDSLVSRTVEVRFRDGITVQREVLVRGGWRVRLPVRDPRFVSPGISAPPGGAEPKLVTQTGHSKPITSVAYSPDGKHVLTGSLDNTVILWEAESGKRVSSFKAKGPVCFAGFSLAGQQVFAITKDRDLHFWNRNTGDDLPVSRVFIASRDRISPGSNLTPAVLTARSSGGRYLILGADLRGERGFLIDLDSRQAIATYPLKARPQYDVIGLAISPDGEMVASVDTQFINLLDARSGKLIRNWKSPVARSVAFSPDGKLLAASSGRDMIAFWDVETGKQVRVLQDKGLTSLSSLGFSSDGSKVVAGSTYPSSVHVWDLATARESVVVRMPQERAYDTADRVGMQAAMSPDGKVLLTSNSTDQSAVLWDVGTGRKLRTLQGAQKGQSSQPLSGGKKVTPFVAFSGGGSHLLTSTGAGRIDRWDLRAGNPPTSLRPTDPEISTLAVSPSGEHVFTCGRTSGDIWIPESGDRRVARGPTYGWAYSAAFSSDGGKLVTGSEYEGTVRVWNVGPRGGLQARPRVFKQLVRTTPAAMAVSPDDRQLLTAASHKVQLWGLPGGRELRSFEIDYYTPSTVAFSPDGKRILTGVEFPVRENLFLFATLWDAQTGEKLRQFSSGTTSGRVSTAMLSPDGRLVLTGAGDGTIAVWDANNEEKPLRLLKGHSAAVMSISCRADGRMLASAAQDGTFRLWDLATGDELARLYMLDNGQDWAAVTPEGLFDGSREGRERVSFRVGQEGSVVPLDRFFRDFYAPGLLTEIGRGERPMPGQPFPASPAPTLKMLLNPDPDHGDRVFLDVLVTDQGGGISGPWLHHNGATLGTSQLLMEQGKSRTYRFVAPLVPGQNVLQVDAATADGSLKSDPAVATIPFNGVVPKPELHVITVGINQYGRGSGVSSLEFCVPDARAIGELFSRRSSGLYARIHVTQLLDADATRAGIVEAVRARSLRAHTQDTLVLYIAAHGIAVGQRFYLLPSDFSLDRTTNSAPPSSPKTSVTLRGYGTDDKREAAIRTRGLAIDELGEVLSKVPALKRVLIFDTCHSGSAIQLAGRQHNPFAFRGAIERFGRSQGVYSLSATAADELAAETRELRHSVLAYTLLAGLGSVSWGPLASQPIGSDEPAVGIDVLRWFRYARGQLPVVSKEFGIGSQNVQISGEDQPTFALFLPAVR